MRRGDRLEFRDLRCTGKYYRERTLRNGDEYTEYQYGFVGVDGREYLYRGRFYFGMEAGTCWDMKASVGYIEGNRVWLKRLAILPHIDEPKLI